MPDVQEGGKAVVHGGGKGTFYEVHQEGEEGVQEEGGGVEVDA